MLIMTSSFCIIGIATSKASVAIFLLRITVIRWHRWVLYAIMVVVAVPCFFCALFDFIRCDPIAAVWNPTLPAKCWVSTKGFTALSITVGGMLVLLLIMEVKSDMSSRLSCRGLRARSIALVYSLELADEAE